MKQAIKFEPGQIVMTSAVNDKVVTNSHFAAFVQRSLQRHLHGDWGELEEQDRQENEYSLDKRLRLFSNYLYPKNGFQVWIITEADRSATTILFPEDY